MAPILRTVLAALPVAWMLAGCACAPSPAERDPQARAMIRSSFRAQGIAGLERLNQDLGQEACSPAGGRSLAAG